MKIEFLLVANHVEVVNNLLYIVGGGWTVATRQLLPNNVIVPNQVGVAASVFIEEEEVRKEHQFNVQVLGNSGNIILHSVMARINVAVDKLKEQPDRVERHAQIGFTSSVEFPSEGVYKVVATLNNGEDIREYIFEVKDVIL